MGRRCIPAGRASESIAEPNPGPEIALAAGLARAPLHRACKERDHEAAGRSFDPRGVPDITLLRATRRDTLELTVLQSGAVGLARCGAERKSAVLLERFMTASVRLANRKACIQFSR